jgi:hypothetical protein
VTHVLDWLGSHWQPVIAAWGAVLSMVLAVRAWWRDRSRVHFWVGVGVAGIDGRGNIVLVRGQLGPGSAVEGGVTTLVIEVYNRSRDPIHLRRDGLRGSGTARIMFFQSEGLPALTVNLEPTDGYSMVNKVVSVAQALPTGNRSARHIRGPFCTDGAGQEYGRRLRRSERRALVEALEAIGAQQPDPSAPPAAEQVSG